MGVLRVAHVAACERVISTEVENDATYFFPHRRRVFSLIALGHAIRLLFGWHVTIENMGVPVWISWIGLVVATYLVYQGFRLSRRIRSELKVFRK